MRPSRIALALVLLSLAVAPAVAQQPRAPAGGMYVNGHFYKGGQFIPRGAVGVPGGFSGGGFGDTFGDSAYMPQVPTARRKHRSTARTTARTEYRTSARGFGGGEALGEAGEDEDAAAKSRIQMARNLIRMGKDAAAMEWLDKVLAQRSSPKVAEEARALVEEIDSRSRPRRSPSTLGAEARTGARSGTLAPAAVAASALPRYFAQIATNGPIRQGQLKGEVGVLESLDAASPIGTAHESGAFDDGQAAWSLTVRGRALSGRFVIAGREFKQNTR